MQLNMAMIKWLKIGLWGMTWLWGLSSVVVLAQTPPPPAEEEIPKVHVVQEGEVLVSIATQYSTTVEALQLVNNLPNPDALYVGQELFIPGVGGTAVPTAYTVQMGDTLTGIAAQFNTTAEAIGRANSLVQPALYAGAQLTLLSRTGSAAPQTVTGTPHVVQAGDTLLALAVRYGLSPQALAEANALTYPVRLFAGQRLRIPSDAPYRYLNDGWVTVEMRPLSIVQGNTLALYVEHIEQGLPTGYLLDPTGQRHEMQFAPYETGYAALVGLDAFVPAGRYTLVLSGEGLERPWRPFTQQFVVRSGSYEVQAINVAGPLVALLAPEIRAEEDDFLAQIFTQFASEKLWDGPFQQPVPEAFVTARYGDGRSYNGGPVTVFHTGIDFGGDAGTPITAPAQGTVVFTGTLNLRGQTVVIDHGWGVMTAYYHLSDIYVNVGDAITSTQQLIGAGGSTGLSTGPHLHWDVRVQGVAVDPTQWMRTRLP